MKTKKIVTDTMNLTIVKNDSDEQMVEHVETESVADKKPMMKKAPELGALNYTPFSTAINVDTDTRDMINTLIEMGYASSQRALVKDLVSFFVADMSEDDQKKFERKYRVAENKTIKQLQKLKKKLV